ncbi:FAD/NAD(P)-dependent oxidoreductase [Cryobacterium tepidiphilum]|uniref:FAD-dependent oxidoreductase n=1 Tax=Cryobacterium tepidiphilum TaxID=2486026 RepID=A0A3M8KTL9_9MICO|nr:NAD(P)/FAD-dependent oxidoreductase [Cryobacterium tepidiphilum]RNE56657.1 FAD-dependent oxidoreductase [Cryobacterium tepidiphilum]
MTAVLVIGAGPAGLAAARAARARGASVTLLDAADELGGQFWRHLPASRPASNERVLHHGWDTFRDLAETLEFDDGCRILRQASVFAIETRGSGPAEVHIVVGEADGAGRDRLVLRPDAIVVATGAHDRTLPFPGWDLPGVFTGGAAQALAKSERLAVGERVVVAGAGPFLLPVAASLAATGSRVVGVFEANRVPALVRGWLPKPWQLSGAVSKGGELAGYVSGHLRHRIPYRLGRMVVGAHGTDRVEAVTIAAVAPDWTPIPGTEQRIEVDAVCVSHGFTPRLELAIAAGCALTADRFVEVDAGQETSVPGVYAAGEVTGIGGADLALAEGTIAGHVAAGGTLTDAELQRPVRRRTTFTRFAERLDAAHGIRSGWPAVVTDDTIVCRCEEVTYGQLRQTVSSTGSRSLRALKLSTRAGLGICQGRVCGRSVETLLAGCQPDGLLGDPVSTDRRPIAGTIRLGELAAAPTTALPTTSTPSPSIEGTP